MILALLVVPIAEMSVALHSGSNRFTALTFARHSVTFLFREYTVSQCRKHPALETLKYEQKFGSTFAGCMLLRKNKGTGCDPGGLMD